MNYGHAHLNPTIRLAQSCFEILNHLKDMRAILIAQLAASAMKL